MNKNNYINKMNYLFILIIIIFYICLNNSVCNGYVLNINMSEVTYTRNGNSWKLYNTTGSENNEWLVSMIYIDKINQTGFSFLEIETNPSITDENQAYFAGYMEGVATHEIIYSYWYNTVKHYCFDTKTKCSTINTFIKQNIEWVKENILNNPLDSYWYHIKLYLYQMYGILDGYNKGAEENRLEWIDIMWLTIFPDILDLRDALRGKQTVGDDHCSVLIKILPDYKDIYFGHDTWSSYSTMLRILKKFTLYYNTAPDSQQKIPGTHISFSSYPGTIGSIDDFYLISSGLAVTETTNVIYNKKLWDKLTPENIVWENIRSVVANRLAHDGETWSNIFKLHNSGTYNNQWMILDYKKFKPGQPPSTGALWVLEQIPTKVIANDLTNIFVDKGYWISYNIPYYKEIYELTGYKDKFEEYGNWFSHEDAPRAKIFKRDQGKVKDMDSFMALMRSNDYQHDPFAMCQCNPPYSATGAIAARDDLNPVNGTYQLKGQGHRPAGAIDAKITNSSLFLKLQFVAVSGPTTGTGRKLPVFKWSKSDFNKINHISQPDVWDFKPVLHKWVYN